MKFRWFTVISIIFLSVVPYGSSSQNVSELTYQYDWYSFWCGRSSLYVEYKDGNAFIDYDILRGETCDNIKPYKKPFEVNYKSVFSDVADLISPEINQDEIVEWQTIRYNDTGICDGGGYNKVLNLIYSNITITVEDIVDNDSCSGTRTNKSHHDILTQIDFIHQFTLDLINEKGTKRNLMNTYFITLYVPIIVTLVIIKRKRG